MKASRLRFECEEGYRYWSDGQADGSTFPVIVTKGACPACGLPFAIREATSLLLPKGQPRRDIPEMLDLDTDAYRLLIDQMISSGNLLEEKSLRIDWWHHLNDALRSGHRRSKPTVDAAWETALEQNTFCLSSLLDETVLDERVKKAELCRERGQFDQCMELLINLPGKYHWVAGLISTHAVAGNQELFGLLKTPAGWQPIPPLTRNGIDNTQIVPER
jgi:hypothetical protein